MDDFRCIHLSRSATSNFKGVDWKQNMYYEGGGLSPVNYRLSMAEEEKLPECIILRSGSGPCFALLSSKDGLAGRSGGGIWKATFLAVTHWPECMIRLRVNKARNRDHSQLWLSQSGYHGNLTNCSILRIIQWAHRLCNLMIIWGTNTKRAPHFFLFIFLHTQGLCYGFFFSCSFLDTVFPAAGALLSQSATAAKLNSQTKHRTQDEKLFIPY